MYTNPQWFRQVRNSCCHGWCSYQIHNLACSSNREPNIVWRSLSSIPLHYLIHFSDTIENAMSMLASINSLCKKEEMDKPNVNSCSNAIYLHRETNTIPAQASDHLLKPFLIICLVYVPTSSSVLSHRLPGAGETHWNKSVSLHKD